MSFPINHDDGTTDKRYEVTYEYCGLSTPMYISRFCDEWLDSHGSESEAVAQCEKHNKERFAK